MIFRIFDNGVVRGRVTMTQAMRKFKLNLTIKDLTQQPVRKIKLKLTPKTTVKLYDGHTEQEWADIGYDIDMYDTEEVFPLQWDYAIKYGRCLECGTMGVLETSFVKQKEVFGICPDCKGRK